MTYAPIIKTNKRNSSSSSDALYRKNVRAMRARYSADLDELLLKHSHDSVMSKKISLIITLLRSSNKASVPPFRHRFIMLYAVEQQISKWQIESL
mmetsp:Transcript_24113/g.30680  ORF Transcript_24113/g.30680 Transcript_24113/m.30680 type:complete len:95 (+) Transcript_24113:230-514(+)